MHSNQCNNCVSKLSILSKRVDIVCQSKSIGSSFFRPSRDYVIIVCCCSFFRTTPWPLFPTTIIRGAAARDTSPYRNMPACSSATRLLNRQSVDPARPFPSGVPPWWEWVASGAISKEKYFRRFRKGVSISGIRPSAMLRIVAVPPGIRGRPEGHRQTADTDSRKIYEFFRCAAFWFRRRPTGCLWRIVCAGSAGGPALRLLWLEERVGFGENQNPCGWCNRIHRPKLWTA